MTDSKNKKPTRSSIFSKAKSASKSASKAPAKKAAPKSAAPKAESKPAPKPAPKPVVAAKKPEPKPAPKPAPKAPVAKAAPKCPEVTAKGGTKAKMEQCLAVLEWYKDNGSSQAEINAALRAYKKARGNYLVTKSRFPHAYDD